jgi:hypothetical protein
MKTNLVSLCCVALVCGSPVAALASTHVSVGIRIGRPAPIIVREAPPRRVSEAIIVSPGPGYVWVEGRYAWSNAQWVWIPGAWMQPPQPGAVWVSGVWDEATRTWTEGHWEIPQPASPPPSVTTPPPAVVVAPAPAPTTIVITSAPPPPRREVRGHRPGRGYVWVGGYWGFEHGHHVWVPGRWVVPPHRHGHWHAPRWERRGGTYVFIEGHWR